MGGRHPKKEFLIFWLACLEVVLFSLDYKGIKPGVAAQPMRTR